MGGKKLLVFFIISILFFSRYSSEGRVITVGNDKNFATINQAIKLAKAGDTVYVNSGVYQEVLLINKPISLIGIGRPVLDGLKKNQILSIHSDHVTVKGFKIINSGISSMDAISGIRVVESSYIIVEDNILEDNYFAINIEVSNECKISGNRITASEGASSNGNGIHCWKSTKLAIVDNYISKHRDGVYFEFVTDSYIARNISEKNNRYGLHFMFSHYDRYSDNIFSENGAGVAVMYSNHVTMNDNRFLKNWGPSIYGLLLKEITDSNIYHCEFEENTIAIMADGASRMKINDCDFEENGYAIKINANCSDVEIKKNNFLSNTFDMSTNGSLMLNTVSENYWDKYEGYDLDEDGYGDVPFRPVNLFSRIVENNPSVMMLFRSFIAIILDKTERLLPTIISEKLKDNTPSMVKVLHND